MNDNSFCVTLTTQDIEAKGFECNESTLRFIVELMETIFQEEYFNKVLNQTLLEYCATYFKE